MTTTFVYLFTPFLLRPMKARASGMALLPVLFIIALITIVVVMFFSLATMQYRSSTTQAAAQDVSSLRDMALNLAIGQLKHGTTEGDAMWISQPGALRTYKSDSGVASNIYKLYSSDEMITAAASLGAGDQNMESDVPANWNELPEVYANLNEPVIRVSGDMAFPVIDPRSMDSVTPAYPGSNTPEGFSYSDKKATGGSINGVHLPGGLAENQRVPMPVQWMYILSNGTYGVLDPTSKNFIPFQDQGSASVPTEENPIIGRIAFWTDDETCKVNINTASEGIHWDTPRAATPEDIAYASRPPMRNEVQRFAGHPASTSLSSVFFPGVRLSPGSGDSNTKLMQIYDMVPRVNYRSGNAQTAPLTGAFSNAGLAVAYDTDRLYASVDEFLLQAPGATTPATRSTQPLFATQPEKLARLRFFLTAESRAPETTALGTPRISLWPTSWDVNTGSNRYTSFDRLAMFAATLGGKSYFYRRYANPYSALSEYGSDHSTAANLQNLKGNADLARYIRALSREAKQGYSKSMTDKYGAANVAAGIMSMLEYVRQTNIHDTTIGTNGSQVLSYDGSEWGAINLGGSETHGQIVNVAYTAQPEPLDAELNSDSLIRANALNRIYTLSEFGLVFSLAAEHQASGTKINAMLADRLQLPSGFKAIQVGTVFEGFCPSQGFAMIAPNGGMYAQGLDKLRIITSKSGSAGRMAGGLITKDNPDYPQAAFNKWGRWNHTVPHLAYLTALKPTGGPSSSASLATWWVGWGGSGGRHMYVDPPTIDNVSGGYETNVNKIGASAFYHADFDVTNRAYASQYSRGYFLVPSGDTHITLGPAGTTLQLYSGYVRHGPAHSVIKHFITIPANMKVPVPTQPTTLAATWGARIQNASIARARNPEVIDPADTVRTWVVRHGDYRLVSLREFEKSANATHNLFIPHPDWNPAEPNASAAQSRYQIHSFTEAGGAWKKQQLFNPRDPNPELALPQDARPLRGLAAAATYTEFSQPDFVRPPTSPEYFPGMPSGYGHSVDPDVTRDWDNGAGIAPDGPYWNKADDVAQIWDDTFKNVPSAKEVPGAIPPYFSKRVWDGVGPDELNETSAPNQLIPSAVMFGSISSGVVTGLPWTTYLFRPNLASTGHLGEKDHSISGNMPGAPADHSILDWFWMPVLQPYAVSEPFSTAGKINMNYRMAPFTHINRATGLHAVMKSERFLAIPTGSGTTYKNYASASGNSGWRHYIDPAKTLIQWEERFNAGVFFKNASEICELFLVPEDENISGTSLSAIQSQMKAFWDNHGLTGDNVLERPYANIYPRLTTRSNSFRVHFLVQSLRKARTTDPRTFDQARDNITGESQGDALIERAIDPNDEALNTDDYNYLGKATSEGSLDGVKSLDTLYNWRIRHVRNFGK